MILLSRQNLARNSYSIPAVFDYATLQKVSTLIDTKNFPALADGIDSFTFSKDEKQILIANNTNPIYRHSFTADYYLYNTATKEISKLFEQVQESLDTAFEKGVKKIKIVTDHGWLLLPGGLPKKELNAGLTETRWGRCALIKEGANTDLLHLP